MKKLFGKFSGLVLAGILSVTSLSPVLAEEARELKPYELEVNTKSDTGFVRYLSSYDTGLYEYDKENMETPARGLAEIVTYNPDKAYIYIVSGVADQVDIAKVHEDGTSSTVKKIDVGQMLADANIKAFDLTSLSYNSQSKEVAIAVQHQEYDQNGYIVILDDEGNYLRHYEAGVQPDMVTFSPDGRYIVSANEGEPRMGYEDGAVDPIGSITVVDLETNEAVNYGFENIDRDQALTDGVLIKKDASPAQDFEPEYVAITADSDYAFVSMQENNAIGKFDLNAKEWIWVKGLELKDHQKAGNELDINRDRNYGGDGIVNPKEAYGVEIYGVQMPDGISVVTIAGKDYVLTANEGDAREWPDEDGYVNIGETDLDGQLDKELEHLIPEMTDGLEEKEDTYYTLGGRSFSIWDADSLDLVYDSGSQMEKTVARMFPEYFNANHEYKSHQIDRRSYKKGPEPETVEVIEIEGSYYAVVALERIGGFMVYDITDPANVEYKDYLNVRQFVAEEALQIQHGPDFDDGDEGEEQYLAENEKGRGDLGPEGVALVSAEDSPTNTPLIIVGNEVTGTVTIAEFNIDGSSDEINEYRTNLDSKKDDQGKFTDIQGHWAEEDIKATEGYSIANGSDKFLPDQDITRAEFVVAIVDTLDIKEEALENFDDVDQDSWYAKAVSTAKEAGLVEGRGNGEFDPDTTITREETISILTRIYKQGSQGYDEIEDSSALDKFEDKSLISDWALEDLGLAVANDLVVGRSDSVLDPQGNITRAETVTLLKRIEDKGSTYSF